jgi:hypothetical protein
VHVVEKVEPDGNCLRRVGRKAQGDGGTVMLGRLKRRKVDQFVGAALKVGAQRHA